MPSLKQQIIAEAEKLIIHAHTYSQRCIMEEMAAAGEAFRLAGQAALALYLRAKPHAAAKSPEFYSDLHSDLQEFVAKVSALIGEEIICSYELGGGFFDEIGALDNRLRRTGYFGFKLLLAQVDSIETWQKIIAAQEAILDLPYFSSLYVGPLSLGRHIPSPSHGLKDELSKLFKAHRDLGQAHQTALAGSKESVRTQILELELRAKTMVESELLVSYCTMAVEALLAVGRYRDDYHAYVGDLNDIKTLEMSLMRLPKGSPEQIDLLSSLYYKKIFVAAAPQVMPLVVKIHEFLLNPAKQASAEFKDYLDFELSGKGLFLGGTDWVTSQAKVLLATIAPREAVPLCATFYSAGAGASASHPTLTATYS